MSETIENYDEKITYAGYKGEPTTVDRLRVFSGYLGYGYNIFDMKVIHKGAEGNKVLWTGYTQKEAEVVKEHIIATGEIPETQEIVFPSRIIVTKEKHGDYYYSIPTAEAFEKVSMSLIKERQAGGYFYEPRQPEPIDITDETIETLPESFREEAKTKLLIYKRAVTRFENDMNDFKDIEKALAGDFKMAARVVRNRTDYEYENYDMVDPIVVG